MTSTAHAPTPPRTVAWIALTLAFASLFSLLPVGSNLPLSVRVAGRVGLRTAGQAQLLVLTPSLTALLLNAAWTAKSGGRWWKSVLPLIGLILSILSACIASWWAAVFSIGS